MARQLGTAPHPHPLCDGPITRTQEAEAGEAKTRPTQGTTQHGAPCWGALLRLQGFWESCLLGLGAEAPGLPPRRRPQTPGLEPRVCVVRGPRQACPSPFLSGEAPHHAGCKRVSDLAGVWPSPCPAGTSLGGSESRESGTCSIEPLPTSQVRGLSRPSLVLCARPVLTSAPCSGSRASLGIPGQGQGRGAHPRPSKWTVVTPGPVTVVPWPLLHSDCTLQGPLRQPLSGTSCAHAGDATEERSAGWTGSLFQPPGSRPGRLITSLDLRAQVTSRRVPSCVSAKTSDRTEMEHAQGCSPFLTLPH